MIVVQGQLVTSEDSHITLKSVLRLTEAYYFLRAKHMVV